MGVLTGLSLFSGAGGLDIAAKWARIRTVCYVENDPYAQGVLMSRMRDGELAAGPIWDDVRTFDGKPWRGKVDCVFGDFPCQPHSRAGLKKGAHDERNLWPEFLRIVQESRPSFVVGENVPGIFDRGFAFTVLADLEREGCCARPIRTLACDSGAPIESARIFFVGHRRQIYSAAECCGWERKFRQDWASIQEFEGVVSNAIRLSIPTGKRGRISDGVAHRIHRLRLCGNGVVPQQALPAFEKIVYMSKESLHAVKG